MNPRLGIIGGGNMGYAIARGALAASVIPRDQLTIAEIDPRKRSTLASLGCRISEQPREAVAAEQVLLAVKPQQFRAVADSLGRLQKPTIVISIMAGISTAHIRGRLGEPARCIRCMPNTPCQLGEGMTGIALGEGAVPGDETLTRNLFEALGRTVMLEESLMHAVTAVSGSGPAYVYFLAELMQEAAQRIGLEPAVAQLLVVQTIIGAGRMMRETGVPPAELRQVVTTPGGTTAAAVEVMMRRDLPGILNEALTAARDRGAVLGAV